MLKLLTASGIVIFFLVFIVEAEKNDYNATFYELNDAFAKNNEQSPNIEDYNIAQHFEFQQTGNASWYGKQFHNRKTASGEKYDMYKLTAAHKKLPFGTIVRVTNTKTGETVLLRITDRGPYAKKRIIDLSYSSAQFVSGNTNPAVKLEALIDKDNLSNSLAGTNYLFGYSYDWPLVCIPQNVVDVIETLEDFDEAIEVYNKVIESHPGQLVFIFTPPQSKQEIFYIGLFRPEIKNNDIEIVKK